jgi:hypothetical protein
MENRMPPDPTSLLTIAGIETPAIGFYDAPDPYPFEPLVRPPSGERACIFGFYAQWLQDQSLHITKNRSGCRGAGYWLCGVETLSRRDFVEFLVDDEGLKASHELMNRWLDHRRPYQQENPHILIGPLRDGQYEHLKTVTFLVNPDQLGLLLLGAQYHSDPEDPPPVSARFGSGCMQLVTLFEDLDIPQACIGATDIAMRHYLPPDILAFTVTKSLFERLCALDERSFLYRRFWTRLQGARGVA